MRNFVKVHNLKLYLFSNLGFLELERFLDFGLLMNQRRQIQELEEYHFPKVKDFNSNLQFLYRELKEQAKELVKELVVDFNSSLHC